MLSKRIRIFPRWRSSMEHVHKIIGGEHCLVLHSKRELVNKSLYFLRETVSEGSQFIYHNITNRICMYTAKFPMNTEHRKFLRKI